MAKKNDAKRAQKKHAKEKKRQAKLADRRATAAVDPVDRWKPEAHGIEGLARLLRTDSHHAARVADAAAAQRAKGAHHTWYPARVRALDTDALLAELAARGVVTEEAGFVALAGGYESARLLAAENWGPAMKPDATVHDRDLVGQAAEVLWERWVPGRPSDEQLVERFDTVVDAWEDGSGETTVDDLLALWDAVRDAGGLARLARLAGSVDDFVTTLLDAVEEQFVDDGFPAEAPHVDADRALAAFEALRPGVAVGSQPWTGLALTSASVLVHADRIPAAVEALLARAAEHPATPALPFEAVELYRQLPQPDEGLRPRVEAAVQATILAAPPRFRPIGEQLLEMLHGRAGEA